MLVVLKTWTIGSREESIAEFTLERMQMRTRAKTVGAKKRRVESCRDGKLARFGHLSYVENEELQAWGTVMPLEDSEQNGEAALR